MLSQNGLHIGNCAVRPGIKRIEALENAQDIVGTIVEDFCSHFAPLSVRPLGRQADGFHTIVRQFPNAGGWNASFCNAKMHKLIGQVEPAQPMSSDKAGQELP
jgi:hypothetical protein